MTILEQHEGIIRLSVFIGVFTLMALLEWIVPRKKRALPRTKRWLTNWGLVVVNTLALRITIPALIAGMAVGVAHITHQQGWGLFSFINLPAWAEIVLAVVILDLLIYAQHIASHLIPVLWRFHKVHHVDRDIDVTTGSRFHPIEILISMGFKMACVLALGAPAIAVVVFEIILNASAMFSHSNIRIPAKLDSIIRTIIVTPDMHRVHHSVIQQETDSNYGFFLSIWDRVFKTYIPQPSQGHNNMIIGLSEHQTQKPASLIWCLRFPFIHEEQHKLEKSEP